MGYANRLDSKRAQLDFRSRMQCSQIGVRQSVFGQPAARKCKCYFSSINRRGKSAQKIRQRADMVLVRMRE